MATLLLLTNDMHASGEILPALELLPHTVKVAAAEATALLDAPPADVILLDARRDLVGARSLCRLIETTGKESPLLVIASEGGLTALSSDWGFDDLLLATAGPAEVDVRLRLAMSPSVASSVDPVIQSGNILIDEAGYSAKLNGVQLDLTYTEFELLKYLAQHPGRVFSRQQLLSDVWGYDYYGGTRTVDVHVRRLRAKLGPEYESVIGTVRNVGYRFVTPVEDSSRFVAADARSGESPTDVARSRPPRLGSGDQPAHVRGQGPGRTAGPQELHRSQRLGGQDHQQREGQQHRRGRRPAGRRAAGHAGEQPDQGHRVGHQVGDPGQPASVCRSSGRTPRQEAMAIRQMTSWTTQRASMTTAATRAVIAQPRPSECR